MEEFVVIVLVLVIVIVIATVTCTLGIFTLDSMSTLGLVSFAFTLGHGF